jgi:hypothetical protein
VCRPALRVSVRAAAAFHLSAVDACYPAFVCLRAFRLPHRIQSDGKIFAIGYMGSPRSAELVVGGQSDNHVGILGLWP